MKAQAAGVSYSVHQRDQQSGRWRIAARLKPFKCGFDMHAFAVEEFQANQYSALFQEEPIGLPSHIAVMASMAQMRSLALGLRQFAQTELAHQVMQAEAAVGLVELH